MYQIRYTSPKEYDIYNLSENRKIDFVHHGKLLDKDIFDTKEDGSVEIIRSVYREAKSLCGILILQKNLLFGKKKRKYIYQCIPDEKFLPSFLVPFETAPSFSKHYPNRFIRFRFDHWEGRHPSGILVETIGKTDALSAYVDYQLYANCLRFKVCSMKDFSYEKDSVCVQEFFTIDPIGCKDFDDGFSVDGDIISVLISNVPEILARNKIWEWNQAFTIYSPTGCRNMLPKLLSENICSLVADGNLKSCIRLDIDMKSNVKTFHLCTGICKRNYVYEETTLLENKQYQILENYAKGNDSTVHDSHDVVEFYMMLFNRIGASLIDNGIYRSTVENETNISFFKFRGEYTCDKKGHAILGEEAYGHFTSPIRRVVDIVNLICLEKRLRLCEFDIHADRFVEFWKNNLEEMNRQSRVLKILQSQWFCLDLLVSQGSSVKVEVVILERSGESSYVVLLKEKSLVMRLETTEELCVNETKSGMLYLLENETTFYKKVKLKLL